MYQSEKEYDLEKLTPIIWELSEEAYTYGSPWSLKQFYEHLVSPLSHYRLRLLKEEVVAYIAYHYLFDEAEIINLAVLSTLQGQKIASNILKETINELEREGMKRVLLDVRQSNKQGINLYQKFGFQIIGERKDYYHSPKEDSFVMVLVLKEER